MCICQPSFLIWVPSLNNIGKCMCEKWFCTCSIQSIFFTTKMSASRPCLTWCRKKRHAYVYPHVLTLCRVRIKWVQTCPRYGCRCTHACKDTKIETKSISPLFRLSPTGEGGGIKIVKVTKINSRFYCCFKQNLLHHPIQHGIWSNGRLRRDPKK